MSRLRVRLPHRARLDGRPRRTLTCINVRRGEKLIFDHLHSWWVLDEGRRLSQVDAFSRVLELALDHPDANAPEGLRRKKRGEPA